MDYLITISHDDGSEKKKYEFKFSSSIELTLSTLITNSAVVERALKSIPAGASNAGVQSFQFTTLRTYTTSPSNFKSD